MFRANIENCEAPKYEKIIDGYFEFLFVDKNGNPVVAMNWHHRLNHMGEAIACISKCTADYRIECKSRYCKNL